MKNIKRLVLGIFSGLLLTAGIAAAAKELDPLPRRSSMTTVVITQDDNPPDPIIPPIDPNDGGNGGSN